MSNGHLKKWEQKLRWMTAGYLPGDLTVGSGPFPLYVTEGPCTSLSLPTWNSSSMIVIYVFSDQNVNSYDTGFFFYFNDSASKRCTSLISKMLVSQFRNGCLSSSYLGHLPEPCNVITLYPSCFFWETFYWLFFLSSLPALDLLSLLMASFLQKELSFKDTFDQL